MGLVLVVLLPAALLFGYALGKAAARGDAQLEAARALSARRHAERGMG